MSHNTAHEGLGILLVDDEEQTLKYFQRGFSDEFQVYTALSAAAAEELIVKHSDDIAVVISDQRMPDRSGVDLLDTVRRSRPDIIRILTTAYADLQQAIEAVNQGQIFRYITKPWDFDGLHQELKLALRVYKLECERKQLINEKLFVQTRMRAVSRAQMMFVTAAALPALAHAQAAIVAYVSDSLKVMTAMPGQADVNKNMELWADVERETNLMSSGAKELASINSLLSSEDKTRISAQDAWLAVAPSEAAVQSDIINQAFDVDAGKIKELLTRFINGCRDWFGDNVLPDFMTDSSVESCFTLQVRAPQSDNSAAYCFFLTDRKAVGSEPCDMLLAYILAHELGGNIKLSVNGSMATVGLQLPYSVSNITPPPNGSILVEQLFRNFEA